MTVPNDVLDARSSAADIAANAPPPSSENAPSGVELNEEDKLERLLLHDERSCIFETRVERAALCRDRGSQQFKQKNIAKAIEWYERAQFHVDFDEGTWHFEFLPKHRDAVNQVRLPVHLNLAMCYLNEATQDLIKAIEQCEAALAIDAANTKALYRCGRAHLLNDDLDEAKKKLKLAAKSAPNDKSIREALQQLAEKMAAHREKEKKTWGGRLLESKGDDDDAPSDSDDEHSPTLEKRTESTQSTPHTASTTAPFNPSILVLLVAVLVGVMLLFLR